MQDDSNQGIINEGDSLIVFIDSPQNIYFKEPEGSFGSVDMGSYRIDFNGKRAICIFNEPLKSKIDLETKIAEELHKEIINGPVITELTEDEKDK